MRVKMVKNNLITEYHLAEHTVFKQFTTVFDSGGAVSEDDMEKFNSQADAVQWIFDWTMARLKTGWEIV